jgi:hypothetical protein
MAPHSSCCTSQTSILSTRFCQVHAVFSHCTQVLKHCCCKSNVLSMMLACITLGHTCRIQKMMHYACIWRQMASSSAEGSASKTCVCVMPGGYHQHTMQQYSLTRKAESQQPTGAPVLSMPNQSSGVVTWILFKSLSHSAVQVLPGCVNSHDTEAPRLQSCKCTRRL